jgi:hypothetical protein
MLNVPSKIKRKKTFIFYPNKCAEFMCITMTSVFSMFGEIGKYRIAGKTDGT